MSENLSNSQSSQSKQPKKITFEMICSFFFGIIFILAGMGAFISSPLAGIIYFLLGLFILPPLNKTIVEKTGVKLGGFVIFIISFILMGIAGSIYSSSLPAKNLELVSNQNSSQSAGQTNQVSQTPTATTDQKPIIKSEDNKPKVSAEYLSALAKAKTYS